MLDDKGYFHIDDRPLFMLSEEEKEERFRKAQEWYDNLPSDKKAEFDTLVEKHKRNLKAL